MARIDGVRDDEAGLVTRQVFGAAGRMAGQVPEPLRIMAHNGHVMWANGLYEMVSQRARTLDAKLKTLASVKVASMIGCVF